MNETIRTSTCVCGQVRCEATGEPILSAVCYCKDCQAGGRLIEALPAAAPVLDADGGAAYLTYRDDRFRCVAGEPLLKGYHLKDTSPTFRYVATCCNTAIYLKFTRGHWVSAYANRFETNMRPPVEMRTNIRFRQAETALPDDAPAYRRFPARLFARLIAARINMALAR